MAERYEVDVIANVQQYIKPLSELPAITKANAEKAALALATSLGSVEGAAADATAKVQAFNKSLIEQGVSEKAAAAATLKYASSLATAGNQAAQATTATGNLGKQADVATERVGNTAQAAVGLGRQLSDVASQLSTGTNPLTILIQQGPQAADAVMMAGFSISKIASAIPPLALAVAALAAGYSVLANATYDAEQAQLDLAVSFDGTLAATQKMQAAALEVEKAHKATTDSQTEAALSLAVMTGQLEEYEVAAGAASRAVVDGAAEERQARQELNAMIGARVEVLRRAIEADETDSSLKPKLIQQHRELTAAYQENIRELRTLEDETALLAGAVGTATVETARAKEKEDELAEARRKGEAATKKREAAEAAYKNALAGIVDAGEDANATALTGAAALAYARDEEIEGIRAKAAAAVAAAKAEQAAAEELGAGAEAGIVARQKAQDAEVAAMVTTMAVTSKYGRQREESLAKATAALSASTSEQLTGLAAIEAAYQRQQVAIDAAADAALTYSTSDAETAAIEAAKMAEQEEAKANYYAALRALDEKYTADLAQQVAEQQRIEQQASNARIQLASTLAGAIGTIAATAGENLTEEQKQAAQVLYAIQKASALAVIALNTILAVSQASTSAPAPYNAIPMAIAGAQGAAQFAAAAASPPPKFHQGTLDAGPRPGAARRGNEFTAVLEGGEAVIPRATMQQPGAKEQAAALVSGRSPVAADEVSKGMDQSSVPYYLSQMVKALSRPIQRAQQARPGHKINYGAR